MTELMLKFNNALFTIANGTGEASASDSPTEISFFEKLYLFLVKAIKYVGNWFVKLFYNLIILIARLVLNVVDFLGLAIKELAGQNTFTSNFSSAESLSKSDMVFRFLMNDRIRSIFRAFIGLGVLLLIIFAIVAIIKKEYESFVNGDSDNNKRPIIVRTLASVFLIIIIPFITFGGILFSNALLSSVNNALGGGDGSTSFASQIFAASTYESNQYRIYADENKRIPITFNFNEVSASSLKLPDVEGKTNSQMESSMQSYLQKSAFSKGVATWWQFYKERFYDFNTVETDTGSTTWKQLYDMQLQVSRVDYYVMADVTDYLLRTRKTLRVINANDLLEKGLFYVATQENYEQFDYTSKNISSWPVVRAVDENGAEIPNTYKFRIYCNGALASTDAVVKVDGNNRYYKEFTFNNTRDESLGAVYLLCTSSVVDGEEQIGLFTNYSESVNKYNTKFYSDYLKENQPIVARGCFSSDGYPTAIRENGSDIEFYRQDVVSPSLVDILPRITYESEDGKFNLAGAINFIVETVTGLDLDDLIPKVYFRNDLFNLFTKETNVVATLNSKQLYLDYNFSDGVPLYGVESVMDMNIVVLVFASVLIVSILFKAVFGLVARIFDLVLLFITYPAIAATLPLDDNRFKTWVGTFVGKLFSAYGIIIGIDLVFIVVNAINTMPPLFSVEFVSNNIVGWGMSAHTLTTLLNYATWLMFYLAAFTLLKTASTFVNGIMFKNSEDLISTGNNVISNSKAAVQKAGDVVSGKALVGKFKGIAGWVPGSGFLADRMSAGSRKNRKELRATKNDIARRKQIMAKGTVDDITKLNGDTAKSKEKK